MRVRAYKPNGTMIAVWLKVCESACGLLRINMVADQPGCAVARVFLLVRHGDRRRLCHDDAHSGRAANANAADDGAAGGEVIGRRGAWAENDDGAREAQG